MSIVLAVLALALIIGISSQSEDNWKKTLVGFGAKRDLQLTNGGVAEGESDGDGHDGCLQRPLDDQPARGSGTRPTSMRPRPPCSSPQAKTPSTDPADRPQPGQSPSNAIKSAWVSTAVSPLAGWTGV